MLRNKFFIYSIFLLLLFPQTTLIGAQELEFQWWVSNMKMAKKSLVLGNDTKEINLADGWVCTVGPSLKGYQGRITVCRKNSETFEFSVMCNQNNPNDHIQIRFKNSEEKFIDYIEVGCQPRDLN